MGAEVFKTRSEGKTADEAFWKAVEIAQMECGNGGYTGTIAEKYEFNKIDLPKGTDPYEEADRLIDEEDERIDDKWGPAGCFDLGPNNLGRNSYLFFGWTSS